MIISISANKKMPTVVKASLKKIDIFKLRKNPSWTVSMHPFAHNVDVIKTDVVVLNDANSTREIAISCISSLFLNADIETLAAKQCHQPANTSVRICINHLLMSNEESDVYLNSREFRQLCLKFENVKKLKDLRCDSSVKTEARKVIQKNLHLLPMQVLNFLSFLDL